MVIMNSITLVDAFLDANKWMELFPLIVSKSRTVQVLSSGVASGNDCLQLMYGELQFLSPLVAAREAYFFRYCQQNSEELGSWIVADFPVDGFVEGVQTCFPWYRRRTSGCIIQDMPNGYSRVMWVEHAEVDDKPVHQVFNQFVTSGMAFGATRWILGHAVLALILWSHASSLDLMSKAAITSFYMFIWKVLYGADFDTGVFNSDFPKKLSSEKHEEDHHLYSLNYMHRGAPKIW
ncbi:hypothetical protein ZIOFF_048243 [Zingiber officinale]|uniref:START domain-containing protein n=1 Tax=Zingiber officinale TaxID=94328 RepID=A0A8J5KU75_ZINOF|nr:hypothetical protein ZIOFF_048243 [Zingiber officinale]